MSEKTKMIKIVTVSAIIFLLLLICSLIINLINLAGTRSKEKKLQAELDALRQQITRNQSTIDYLSSDEAIERFAREQLNMQNKNDKTYYGSENDN